MPRPDLTPEPRADTDALRQHLIAAVAAGLDGLAELLAAKGDRNPFGAAEFQVRDLVPAIGAKALQAAAGVGEKRATTGAPAPAPAAARRPSSSGGRASGS